MNARVKSMLLLLTGMLLGIIGFSWTQSIAHKGPHLGKNWRSHPQPAFTNAQKMFQKAKKLLKHHYVDSKVTEDKLYKAAVQGMLHYIDPKMSRWNRLITPSEHKELQIALRHEIVGIGIMLRFEKDDGYATILGLIPGSPAKAAGLRSGDKILKVDGHLFKGKSFRKMVYAIRGKVGTHVKLTLLRGGKLREVTVKRNRIRWDAVTSHLFKDGVGYLRIDSFSQKTPVLVEKHLKGLRTKKARALIIDLRGNRGGLLKTALQSADLFLKKGAIITQLKKRKGKVEAKLAKRDDLSAGLPIHLLSGPRTSSGAELFIAALRDNRGARVIGSRTLGKWSAQTLSKLGNGYFLKFTVSHFLSPKGKSYQFKGLTPDIQVKTPKACQRLLREHRKLSSVQQCDSPLRIAKLLLAQRSGPHPTRSKSQQKSPLSTSGKGRK